MAVIEYQATTLSEYSITFTSDRKQIEAVKNPRRIETHFRSPQLDHGPRGETEWLMALKQPERNKRPNIKRLPENVVQLRFPEMQEWWRDQDH